MQNRLWTCHRVIIFRLWATRLVRRSVWSLEPRVIELIEMGPGGGQNTALGPRVTCAPFAFDFTWRNATQIPWSSSTTCRSWNYIRIRKQHCRNSCGRPPPSPWLKVQRRARPHFIWFNARRTNLSQPLIWTFFQGRTPTWGEMIRWKCDLFAAHRLFRIAPFLFPGGTARQGEVLISQKGAGLTELCDIFVIYECRFPIHFELYFHLYWFLLFQEGQNVIFFILITLLVMIKNHYFKYFLKPAGFKTQVIWYFDLKNKKFTATLFLQKLKKSWK